MALANPADVEAALRRSLTPEELEWISGLLETASDLVIGYLHPCPIPTPTPEAISRVVADMVAAVLERPGGDTAANVSSATMGPFSVGFTPGSTSPGPYLTVALKERLAPFRCGTGMVSVQLGSERY
jgi:hypothetical protein